MRHKLGGISSTSDDGAQRLKEEYLQKLNVLEAQVCSLGCKSCYSNCVFLELNFSAFQVSELKKKQEAQAQILRQKQKSDDAARRLQDEIHRIKTQKVNWWFTKKNS